MKGIGPTPSPLAQQDWAGAWESACLTGSLVIPMYVVLGALPATGEVEPVFSTLTQPHPG